MRFISSPTATPPTLLRKGVALVVTAAVFGVMLMFSAVLLAALFVLALAAGVYLWWKTRKVRKMMRDMRAAANDGNAYQAGTFGAEAFRPEAFRSEAAKGEVIEGIAVRVHEPREGAPR